MREERDAAIKVQAIQRGRQDRQRAQSLKTEKEKREMEKEFNYLHES